jgi:hypothetical protein
MHFQSSVFVQSEFRFIRRVTWHYFVTDRTEKKGLEDVLRENVVRLRRAGTIPVEPIERCIPHNPARFRPVQRMFFLACLGSDE